VGGKELNKKAAKLLANNNVPPNSKDEINKAEKCKNCSNKRNLKLNRREKVNYDQIAQSNFKASMKKVLNSEKKIV
jgi:hypothetical protein